MNKAEREIELERIIRNAFYSGMTYGYGVDHENIHEEVEKAWQEYKKDVPQLN